MWANKEKKTAEKKEKPLNPVISLIRQTILFILNNKAGVVLFFLCNLTVTSIVPIYYYHVIRGTFANNLGYIVTSVMGGQVALPNKVEL
jgi:hypothetical protein